MEKVSTTRSSSVKKPSPPPLKPQMSKNVLSIMELDEMDDDEAGGDGIDGVEKVVGMAATPPQNNGTLTTSLFEVIKISVVDNMIWLETPLTICSHSQKHFRRVGFTPTSSSVSTPLGASPSSKFWVGDGDDSSSEDEQQVGSLMVFYT